MPHTYQEGQDVIHLKNAKIAQKNFTVLNEVNLLLKKENFATSSEKRVLVKVHY